MIIAYVYQSNNTFYKILKLNIKNKRNIIKMRMNNNNNRIITYLYILHIYDLKNIKI